MELQKWEELPNYIGANLSEYYIGPLKTRDSEVLENVNFNVALERLGGENHPYVMVARFNHWACGWYEQIIVREDAKDALAILQEIGDELESCPVLDEDAYSEALSEDFETQFDLWVKSDLIKYLNLREDGTQRLMLDEDERSLSFEDFYSFARDIFDSGYCIDEPYTLQEWVNRSESESDRIVRIKEQNGQMRLPQVA